VLGNEVAVLVNEEKSPGKYEVEFNTSNLPYSKAGLSIGIYCTGEFNQTNKMILIQ